MPVKQNAALLLAKEGGCDGRKRGGAPSGPGRSSEFPRQGPLHAVQRLGQLGAGAGEVHAHTLAVPKLRAAVAHNPSLPAEKGSGILLPQLAAVDPGEIDGLIVVDGDTGKSMTAIHMGSSPGAQRSHLMEEWPRWSQHWSKSYIGVCLLAYIVRACRTPSNLCPVYPLPPPPSSGKAGPSPAIAQKHPDWRQADPGTVCQKKFLFLVALDLTIRLAKYL